jgi:hypothetical protein
VPFEVHRLARIRDVGPVRARKQHYQRCETVHLQQLYVRPPEGGPPLKPPGPLKNAVHELGKLFVTIAAMVVHTPGSEAEVRLLIEPGVSPPTSCWAALLAASCKLLMQVLLRVDEQVPSSFCPLNTEFASKGDSQK